MLSLYPLLLTLGITTAPTAEPRFAGAVEGTWDGQFRPSVVFLHMRVDRDKGFSTFGRTYALEELDEFRREKKAVGFELRRDAGTFRFDGASSDLRANGTFEFIPSPNFKKSVEKIGFRKLDRHHQLTFALHDVTVDELKYLRRTIHGKTSSADMVRLLERGATPEFVRDLAGIGFTRLTPEVLLRARESGVSADYVRALRAAGLRLTFNGYIQIRDKGLTAEYVGQLKAVGLVNLTPAEYLMLLEHDVTAEYAASIYELGYAPCGLDDLVRLRNHGITASFIAKANQQAGEVLTVGELIRYRTRGEY